MKSTRVSRFVQNNKRKHISVQEAVRWKVEMKILSIAKTNLTT